MNIYIYIYAYDAQNLLQYAAYFIFTLLQRPIFILFLVSEKYNTKEQSALCASSLIVFPKFTEIQCRSYATDGHSN
jgi:hypothetical protein